MQDLATIKKNAERATEAGTSAPLRPLEALSARDPTLLNRHYSRRDRQAEVDHLHERRLELVAYGAQGDQCRLRDEFLRTPVPMARQPAPVPAQPQAQPTGQHIGQMVLWNLLLLLFNARPDHQIHIECPFDELSTQTRFKCAAGTVQIGLSARYSHTIATHLMLVAPPAVPATAQISDERAAGSPGDTTMHPALHTSGWTARGEDSIPHCARGA